MSERISAQEFKPSSAWHERVEAMFAEADVVYLAPDQVPVGSVVVEGDVPISEFNKDHINYVEGKKADLDNDTDGVWWVSLVEKEEGGYYEGLVNVYTLPGAIEPVQREQSTENIPPLVKVYHTSTGRPIGIVK